MCGRKNPDHSPSETWTISDEPHREKADKKHNFLKHAPGAKKSDSGGNHLWLSFQNAGIIVYSCNITPE
jgi:hypothetical protein